MNVSLSRRRFLEATAGLSVLGAATPLKARDPSRLAGSPCVTRGRPPTRHLPFAKCVSGDAVFWAKPGKANC